MRLAQGDGNRNLTIAFRRPLDNSGSSLPT
jgi:hypothetical protein